MGQLLVQQIDAARRRMDAGLQQLRAEQQRGHAAQRRAHARLLAQAAGLPLRVRGALALDLHAVRGH